MVEQNIIPLGAKCRLSGRFEVPAMVASRSLGSEDGQTTLVLDFEGVAFDCASSPYDQTTAPNLLRLQLRVNEGEETTPSAKLLKELARSQRLRRRRLAIYGEDDSVANSTDTPIKDIGEIFPQRDFQTGQRYQSVVITVARTMLLQEPVSEV